MVDTPWLLPADWRWRRFDEVARVASRLVDPAGYADSPHIAPNHIESQTGRLLPYGTVASDGVTSSKHQFSAGQVLYSKIRPYLAKVVVAEFDGLCSADMYPIESELESRFLKWWMLTREFTRRAAGEQARTVLPKINVRGLSALPVPVPPIAEQRRIVEILEDHLSRLEAADGYLRSTASRVRTHFRAQVQQCFVGATAHADRWASIEEIAGGVRSNVIIGPFGSSLKTSDYTDSGVPLVFVKSVRSRSFDGGRKFVSTSKASALAAHIALPGDLLITKMGDPPGDAAIYTGAEPAIVTADVIRLRPSSEFDARYLVHAFNSPSVRRLMDGITRGVAQKKVSLDRFRSEIRVPAYDLDEQREIALQLDDAEHAAARLESATEAARRRSVALRRSLLQAAFSGHLTRLRSDTGDSGELADA